VGGSQPTSSTAPTTTEGSSIGQAALCAQVERLDDLRARDVTAPQAIADLVASLPEAYRVDAALFYYPYGGTIPDNADRAGIAAQAAGDRLRAYYDEQCGER
jgi:hypothetical protein